MKIESMWLSSIKIDRDIYDSEGSENDHVSKREYHTNSEQKDY